MPQAEQAGTPDTAQEGTTEATTEEAAPDAAEAAEKPGEKGGKPGEKPEDPLARARRVATERRRAAAEHRRKNAEVDSYRQKTAALERELQQLRKEREEEASLLRSQPTEFLKRRGVQPDDFAAEGTPEHAQARANREIETMRQEQRALREELQRRDYSARYEQAKKVLFDTVSSGEYPLSDSLPARTLEREVNAILVESQQRGEPMTIQQALDQLEEDFASTAEKKKAPGADKTRTQKPAADAAKPKTLTNKGQSEHFAVLDKDKLSKADREAALRAEIRRRWDQKRARAAG
jgi:hypothetical protein